MDLFETFMLLDEGTWAVPYWYDQAKVMADIITSKEKITLQTCKFANYNDEKKHWVFRFPYGDDSFYNELSEGSSKYDDRDIRPIVKKYIARMVTDWIEDPDSFYNKFEYKAIEVLANACGIKLPDNAKKLTLDTVQKTDVDNEFGLMDKIYMELGEDFEDTEDHKETGPIDKLGEETAPYKFLANAVKKTTANTLNLSIGYIAEANEKNNPHYVAELYGGLNGTGDWLTYLDELEVLFKETDCWMIDLTNDTIDDVFVLKIGFNLPNMLDKKKA